MIYVSYSNYNIYYKGQINIKSLVFWSKIYKNIANSALYYSSSIPGAVLQFINSWQDIKSKLSLLWKQILSLSVESKN